jgi:hypothetical protein
VSRAFIAAVRSDRNRSTIVCVITPSSQPIAIQFSVPNAFVLLAKVAWNVEIETIIIVRMFDALGDTAAGDALARLEGAVDDLLAADRSSLPAPALLELVRRLEVQTRRLAAVDQRNLAEIEQRHLAVEMRMRDSRALLVDMLRIDPHEAKRRVALARDLGPRHGLTGEALGPIAPAVAKACAEGAISVGHAQKIVTFTENLPPELASGVVTELQQHLLDAALHTTPSGVGSIASAWMARIDQDGVEPRDEALQRRRAFTLHTDSEGWSKATGFLSPRLTAVVKTVLDSLAAPAPANSGGPPADEGVAVEGGPDLRSHSQRCHDGLQDALERVLRSGELPDVGGAPVTVLVTVRENDLRRGVGAASTAHGDLLPIKTLVAMAVEADIIPTYLSDSGGVIAYGRAKRLATPAQRRALAARDGGCTRPGCTLPPGWCEAHHVIPWAQDGPTDLANMALVCPRDHQLLDRGWDVQMIAGVPHWLAPDWVDPAREPRRNQAHHAPIRFAAPV